MNLFNELKRRNVIRVAGLYLVGSWLLIQVASTMLPTFEVPTWALRGLIIVLALGLIPTLILSWVFELTPQGLKRDDEISPEQSIAPQTGRRIDRLIIVALVLALGYFCFDKFVLTPRREAALVAAASSPNEHKSPIPEKSIAVLPFENLSDDKSNAYFAAGIQDEILTRLSKIADLKVISRTSTQRYASAPDNLHAIGNQLGVANLLEGSVQKAGQAVHINVQLIKAATDAHLWAESYDRELQNIFGVEGEVAGKIAEALNARLTGTEEKAIAQKPTSNTQAYDAFLRARATDATRFDLPGEIEVANDYTTAVRLDPNFALAWANLAAVRSFLYFNAVDRATNSPAAIQEAADRAFALDPDLGEAWLARGVYRYRVLKDLSGALEAFKEALKRLPNSAEVFADMAFVERRMSRWDAAISHFQKAAQLDPRNLQVCIYAGETMGYLRRFAEAHQFIDRALQIAPEGPRALLAEVSLFQAEGRLADAAQTAARIKNDDPVISIDVKTTQLIYERRFDDAAAGLQSFLKPMTPGGSTDLVQQALLPILGYCQERAGRIAEAKASYALAVREIKPTPDTVVPADQTHLPVALTQAYAGLGDKENALAAGRKAIADYANDALLEPDAEAALAQAEAQLGEIDAALAMLPHLLEVPGGLTPGLLKLDPNWDPLRKDPRFQKLLNSPPPGDKGGPR